MKSLQVAYHRHHWHIDKYCLNYYVMHGISHFIAPLRNVGAVVNHKALLISWKMMEWLCSNSSENCSIKMTINAIRHMPCERSINCNFPFFLRSDSNQGCDYIVIWCFFWFQGLYDKSLKSKICIWCRIDIIGGSKGDARDDPNSFNFMQFLGKNWPNNSFMHPPLELAPPPPKKSWIRHWTFRFR